MKRMWRLAATALAIGLLASPGLAAQDKWVRGPVTAMSADTVTVTVKGAAMVFKVETSTQLIARGAGTAAREAEAAGKAGPRLGDFVKVGQHVEVRFRDEGAAKIATELRPIASEDEAMSQASGSSALGTVVVVSADSLTITDAGKEWKFAITPKTKVIGRGAGTKTRAMAESGKPATLTEFIGVKDRVLVYFIEAGGAMQASEIRVTQKAIK